MVAGHGNHSYTLKTMEDLIPMNVIHTLEKLVFIQTQFFSSHFDFYVLCTIFQRQL